VRRKFLPVVPLFLRRSPSLADTKSEFADIFAGKQVLLLRHWKLRPDANEVALLAQVPWFLFEARLRVRRIRRRPGCGFHFGGKTLNRPGSVL
jgi:hypothetical protein